ncbi:hypothetical protein ACFYM0_02775 [Streptomyces sp. NPDC006487]
MSAPLSVRLPPDGYVVSCETLAGIEGHGPTLLVQGKTALGRPCP